MGCEEDVFRIVKKIDKMVTSKTTNAESALDYLNTLNKLPITLEVLQKTRVGMSVNQLRKSCSDDSVISLSKTLIKGWKKLLGGASDKNEKTSSSSLKKDMNKLNESKNESSQNTSNYDIKQNSFPKTSSNTSDSVRLKCREMLANSLKGEGELPDGAQDPDEISAQVEDEIFNEFKDVNMKYKNRVRSRIANLKDSKNRLLRVNVLTGVINPEKLATMSADEMASEEMKELRQKFTKEAINDHQMAVTSGTKTSLLKCGKCKKRNCTYNQVQTRSADEPMTTFVFCNECGHRWKFC